MNKTMVDYSILQPKSRKEKTAYLPLFTENIMGETDHDNH